MKPTLFFRAGLVAVPLLLATSAFAADSTATGDELITAKVQAALAADKRLQVRAPLEVRTQDGVVQIVGDVKTPAMVYRAVETARTVEGVKDVDTNRLDAP